MTRLRDRHLNSKQLFVTLLFPVLFLCAAYSVLFLTLTQRPEHLMERCVLMNLNFARIWSVAHIELGMSYVGVFIGMTYYLIRAGRADPVHFRDLGLAFAYLVCSFILDYVCVRAFSPFYALLIGDAVVMTFTLLVSKQLWFQRLLGIFVPLVFITCAIGHLLEGMSFWHLTYPENVPWTMVTADIGFAVLVNATRFPAFIRGHDLENEINEVKKEMRNRQKFLMDVLASVTDYKLRLALDESDLPMSLRPFTSKIPIRREALSFVRAKAKEIWQQVGFPDDRETDMVIGVGEAIMNAVVHGGEGSIEFCCDENQFQVWIEDKGPGIELNQLHRATLQKGYSTTGTLGQGFWIILQTIDRLDLFTSTKGTTLVLSYNRIQSPEEPSLRT